MPGQSTICCLPLPPRLWQSRYLLLFAVKVWGPCGCAPPNRIQGLDLPWAMPTGTISVVRHGMGCRNDVMTLNDGDVVVLQYHLVKDQVLKEDLHLT